MEGRKDKPHSKQNADFLLSFYPVQPGDANDDQKTLNGQGNPSQLAQGTKHS
ncbi:MAG: hypothetical protein Fur0016_14480 [Anaerolineales bacterium]